MARTPIQPRRRTTETPRLKVINPGKGLNVLVSENLIDNREATSVQNIEYVEAGGISKRNGYTQVGGDLSNNPRGLGVYIDTSNNKHVCTIDGTTLKYIKNDSGTWTSATGDTFTSGKTTTFTQAQNKMFVWNGSNGGAYFDGSAVTRPGTMPSAAFGLYYKGLHIVSGTSTQRNRVYIAEGADATDFTNASGASTLNNSTEVPGATLFDDTAGTEPAQFIDIDKDDGDKITGLCTFQDSVIVFKENSIHQMTFDADGVPSVALVTRAMGCVSHKSIDNAENDVFFLSRRGMYVLGNEPQFFSAVRTNELSTRISPQLKLIDQANLPIATAIYYDYRYYLAVPETTQAYNNVLWTYDRRFLAFAKSKTDSINAEAFTTYYDTNSEEHLYFTCADDTKVYEIDSTYNDDGAAIDSYWQSKAFDADEFDLEKRWLYVDLQFRKVSGVISVDIFTDNNTLAATTTITPPDTTGEIGTLPIGLMGFGGDPADQTQDTTTNVTNVVYRVPIRKNSRTCKVKISNNREDQNFTLTAIVFGYIPFTQYKFNSTNKLQTS